MLSTKKENFMLFILAAIQFTHIMDFMIIMPLSPQLMRVFHIGPQEFGMLVSAYTFSAGIAGFLAAFIIDKFDRRSVLNITYLGFIIGTFACAIAPNYPLLLIARVVAGLFGGVISSQILSIVGDQIPPQRRGKAMGTVMASFSMASVFGVPFGLYLSTLMGWHAPFYFLVIIAAAIAVVIPFSVPPMRGHIQNKQMRQHPFSVITNIARSSNQMLALLLMVMLMLGQFSVIPFISPYMVANVGFQESDLTYIYLIGGALTIFTSPVVGKLADKYGKHIIFMIFGVISLIPLLLITNMPPIHIGLVLTVTTLFFIASNGRMIPAMALITSTVEPRNRGGFMSINSSLQSLSSGLAAFIAGLIISRNPTGQILHYEYVGYIAVVMTIACILLVRKIKSVDNVMTDNITPKVEKQEVDS